MSRTEKIRICLCDDDTLVCVSLKTIIEADGGIEVLETGHSADAAVEMYGRLSPQIMLMDIRMGEKTGLDACEEIIAKDKTAKILFLTTFDDDEYIIRALKIGAKGYILKQHFEAIVPALKAVSEGHSVFGDEIVTKLPSLMAKKKEPPKGSDISEKELEIITLVAQGLSNREIASQLFLSEGTVRNYISTVLEKLELRDRTQLAIYYYKYIE